MSPHLAHDLIHLSSDGFSNVVTDPLEAPLQDLHRELEDCIAEFMWASLVFYRQWGVQARDLVLRPPEWYVLLMRSLRR